MIWSGKKNKAKEQNENVDKDEAAESKEQAETQPQVDTVSMPTAEAEQTENNENN